MTQEQLQAKRAFRIAFDFLNAHLPVEGGEGYWLKTAEDLWNGWKGGERYDGAGVFRRDCRAERG